MRSFKFTTAAVQMGTLLRRLCALFLVLFFCSSFIVEKCFAEDIVSYRVKTTSSEDWNLAVNGITFVRHRPTGFGLCMYSGSLNRVVSNGVNVISFLRNDNTVAIDAKNDSIELAIDYISDYGGEPTYEQSVPLLRCGGFCESNLLFTVDRAVKRLSRERRRLSASGTSAGWLWVVAAVLYVFFVNLYGFIMIVNDKKYSKTQQIRIPTARFFGNILLGGGVGVVLGVFIKRHDMDRKFLFVLIPALMLIQAALVMFAFSPGGKKLIREVAPWKPALRVPSFNKASDFLNSMRKNDPPSF